ncbi:MAG TPA: hypothetical protein VGH11_08305 [Jatrophihabitans sp.]
MTATPAGVPHDQPRCLRRAGQRPARGRLVVGQPLPAARERGPITWTASTGEYGSAAGAACIRLPPTDCAVLFADTNVALAYRLPLGTCTGVVPDGIVALGVDDPDWAGTPPSCSAASRAAPPPRA